MKVLAAAAMSISLLDPVFAQTPESEPANRRGVAAPASQTLVISRSGSRPPTQGSAENFTGAVRVDPLFQAGEPARASGAYVTFAPGAHSAWHTHPLGQTLVVTAGVGRVQRWGERVEEIRPGDVVWIPPGQKHWHGAAPETSMTHIAVRNASAAGASTGRRRSPTSSTAKRRRRASWQLRRPRPRPGQPTPAQRMFGDIAPKLADLTDNVLFGDVWARPELSPRDRSLVTVSALIAMNRPDQLRSHMGRARDNGVTQVEIVETITHLAFYAGWPSAVTAAGVAKDVFAPK